MHIGLVIYGSLDTLSGGYYYDRRLVEYLRAQGDTVEIISLKWRNYAAHLGDNITFRLPRGFDLLIEDELNHPSLLAANAGRHPAPVVSLVHHLRASEQRPAWQNLFYRAVEKRYLRSVDGFIFNSQTTRAEVTALAGDRRPAIVAYPPTDRFGSPLDAAFATRRASEPGPLRLVFLGNLISRKGLHILLEALARLPAGAATLDVIGSLTVNAAYVASLQRQVQELDLSARVHFLGALDESQLEEGLRRAHALVVPSSYEGFGIVYLEGMAFGLPAIGTNVGAAPEIIADGRTGFLVHPDGVGSLASRLTLLAEDRGLLARMSVNALERYRRQPSWEQTAGEIRQFLLGLLNKESGK